MTKLPIWIAATIAWLLLFFSVERFHEPINLASFVYVLASAVAITVVALPRRNSSSLRTLLLGTLCLHLGLKLALGYQILGPSLSITVTEAAGLLITVLLAQRRNEFFDRLAPRLAHDVTDEKYSHARSVPGCAGRATPASLAAVAAPHFLPGLLVDLHRGSVLKLHGLLPLALHRLHEFLLNLPDFLLRPDHFLRGGFGESASCHRLPPGNNDHPAGRG